MQPKHSAKFASLLAVRHSPTPGNYRLGARLGLNRPYDESEEEAKSALSENQRFQSVTIDAAENLWQVIG